MKLDMLRMLADNGQPLVVEIHQEENGTQVTRGNRMVEKHGGPELTLQELQEALEFYPRAVTVNGEHLKTRAWPGLARVKITLPETDGSDSWRRKEIEFPGNVRPGWKNALAGGVFCRINTPRWDDGNHGQNARYFTHAGLPDDGNHVPLSAVNLEAFLELKTSELDIIQENRNSLEIPGDAWIPGDVTLRRQNMIERTLLQPNMPTPWDGRTYSRPLQGPDANEHGGEPYAAGVRGTPLVIDGAETGDRFSNDLYLTVVENLVRGKSLLVPVMDGQQDVGGVRTDGPGAEAARAKNITFEILQHPENPGWARSITMRIMLQDGVEHVQECSFQLSGQYESDAGTVVVPGAIRKEELTEILTRAYWPDTEWRSWDDVKEERMLIRERMEVLAEHAFGNTREGIRMELQRMADRFYSRVPLPSETIQVKSRNGRLEIVLNPQEAELTPAE